MVRRCHSVYFQSKHPYWLTPAGWDALTDGKDPDGGVGASACENPDQRLTAE